MSQNPTKPGNLIDEAADALAGFDALAGTHLLGLAAPILLPWWCRESLARDAARTGRTTVSIAAWALGWPFGTAVVLMLPALPLALSGPSASWAGILIGGWAVAWLVVPFAVGIIVASRARRLGGFGAGIVGLALGGLVVGIAVSVIELLGALAGSSAATGPLGALIWIPLMTAMIPVLTAAQFGFGVIGGSIVAGLRAR